jgi:hypothetical protein
MNWRDVLEDVLQEMEELDDLVFPDEETDSQSDSEDADEETESLAERVLSNYLQLENYEWDQRAEFIEALKKIISTGDLVEYFRIGSLLIYLSERRFLADEIFEFLDY